MFHIEDVLQLKDGEKVSFIVRRHAITLAPGLFLALVLIVLPFFLMFPMFSWGVFGLALFVISVVIGIAIAIRTLLIWDADVLVLTNIRLVDVDQKGIFTRLVTEALLEKIQDVSWSKVGIIESIFRVGTVKVQTAGASAMIEAHKVSKPEMLHQMINDLKQDAQPAASGKAPDQGDKVKSIGKMLENYSLEELQRIETILKTRERAAVTEAFLAQEKKEADKMEKQTEEAAKEIEEVIEEKL
ncbi:MAG: PH domain-containing protein [Patescibacteria group bacterium]|nr:PH domain-containing protein [Patescibacteria group bacterium]